MNCQDFDNRLYDEDCRKALLGKAPRPQDLEEHLRSCPRCRENWAKAGKDTRQLSVSLLFDAPTSLADLPMPEMHPRASLCEILDLADLGWRFQPEPSLPR